MQSTLTPDVTDPHDIFVIEPDVVLAARADRPAAEARPVEQAPHGKVSQDLASPSAASPAKPPVNLAEAILGDILNTPSTPTPSSLKPRVAPEISVAAPVQPVKSTPRVEATFRATAASADAIAGAIKAPNEIKVPDDIRLNGPRPGRGAWARRASMAFLFAFGSVVAAQGWHRYGDTARHMVAQWTPALAQLLPSSQPAAATTQPTAAPATTADPSGLPAAQAAVPPAQTAVADQTASPPAPAAIAPAQDAPATTAAAAPSAQQLQSMTQDIASMGQQIEALKATIAQLKAGQEQMAQQISRDVVRNAVVRNSDAKVTEPRSHIVPPPRHQAYSAAPPPPVRRQVRATYYPPAASAMNVPPPPPYPAPPPVAAPPMQSMDAIAPDGDPVVRPPMPLH